MSAIRALHPLPLFATIVLVCAAAPSTASAKAGGCRGIRATVGGKATCVRVGQRCRHAQRSDYLMVGLDCVRKRGRYVFARASLAAVRQGRVIALPRSGRPTFQQALWWFDRTVAPLPGVRVPRGAVGTDHSGTAAITALSRYTSRLSSRQRAVLNRLLRPHPAVTIDPSAPDIARARVAASPAGLGDFPAIVAEALVRLKAHGVIFHHAISLEMQSTDNNKADHANTLPTWLLGTGSVCAISFFPKGVGQSVFVRRQVVVHELMHCASFEYSPSRPAWYSQPLYLSEGLPEWAAERVAVEWQGQAGLPVWWLPYLRQPWLDVRTRTYDGMGLWSLFEHEGVDVWKLLPDLVHAGNSGHPEAPLNVGLASAPATTVADWGSTLATAASLSARWNLDGGGMPNRPEPTQRIDDGGSWSATVAAGGAYELKLDLQADVVHITRTENSVEGWLRDGAGSDHALGSDDRYCVRQGGCTCPNGRNPTIGDIPTGESHLGFADDEKSAAVVVEGETLDKVCKAAPPGGIEVHREIGSQDVRVAAFRTGKCTIRKKAFTATATDSGYTLTIRISAFKGYGVHYPISYGIADPGVRSDRTRRPVGQRQPTPRHAADNQRDRVQQIRHAAVAELPRRGLERTRRGAARRHHGLQEDLMPVTLSIADASYIVTHRFPSAPSASARGPNDITTGPDGAIWGVRDRLEGGFARRRGYAPAEPRRPLLGVLDGQVGRSGTDVTSSAVRAHPLYVDSDARRGRSVLGR